MGCCEAILMGCPVVSSRDLSNNDNCGMSGVKSDGPFARVAQAPR